MAQQLSLFASPEPEEAPVKPVPAAAPAQPPQPQKHFNTLSAAEYRALNKLTAPVPARTLPGTSGVMELNSVRAPFNAPSTPQFAAPAPPLKRGTEPPPMKCWPWPRKLWTAVCRRFVPMAAPAC